MERWSARDGRVARLRLSNISRTLIACATAALVKDETGQDNWLFRCCSPPQNLRHVLTPLISNHAPTNMHAALMKRTATLVPINPLLALLFMIGFVYSKPLDLPPLSAIFDLPKFTH